MVLNQSLWLYRGGKEIYKRPTKITVKEIGKPKQSIKKYWESIVI